MIATTPAVQLRTVTLEIIFDAESRRIIHSLWHIGMTALDQLRRAINGRRGITLTVEGVGTDVFVTEIDGQANRTSGIRGYWMYRVNGDEADVSCGVCELKPSDTVTWEYTLYDESLTKSGRFPRR